MRFVPYIRKLGNPPKEYSVDLSRLDGGLNLWELDYRLEANQSPSMLNMYWVDGALSSRRGQQKQISIATGAVVAAYPKEYLGRGIFHAGNNLYTLNLSTLQASTLKSNIGSSVGGSFFVFGGALYYKTVGVYLKIEKEEDSNTLKVTNVEGYVPVLVINSKPDGTGATLYQAENRLSPYKIAKFTSDNSSKTYVLPVKNIDSSFTPVVKVNGKTLSSGAEYSVDYVKGTIQLQNAAIQTDPITPNNVEIKFAKTDKKAMDSVMSCRFAETFGTSNDVCVVMGGSSIQPNAYFWSGVNIIADVSYFPADYYNLAGQEDGSITGFGKQQSMLVIFKERTIGKTYFTTEMVDGMEAISLPYTSINTTIGCNIPKSIQLIMNNLVFANTYGGVYFLSDTNIANENNVMRISRNINGTTERKFEEQKRGLLYDLAQTKADKVCSVDDGTRYWIVANGNAYLWDYTLSGSVKTESQLSWFKFNNIQARAFMNTLTDIIYGTETGDWVQFINEYSDFGQPISREYTFAVQSFGTFERLKDVFKVIFSTRTDERVIMNVYYKTDYGTFKDATPIISMNYKLCPRNLLFRSLDVLPYSKVSIRNPGAKHCRHFSMKLTNNAKDSGMSLVSAQILYRFTGGER